MAKKLVVKYRKRLAAIFISFGILLVGTSSLLRSMSLDYYTVLGTLFKIGPACLILGGLGWVMGMILDQPRRRSSISVGVPYMGELMKHDLVKDLPEADDSISSDDDSQDLESVE